MTLFSGLMIFQNKRSVKKCLLFLVDLLVGLVSAVIEVFGENVKKKERKSNTTIVANSGPHLENRREMFQCHIMKMCCTVATSS